VKALSRALAVSVLERVDEPLAQSNPLTRELKSAFADAITWAPGYPGIGRIPRVIDGVAYRAGHELESSDLDLVVENMLADERGKKSFVLGGDEGLAGATAAPSRVTHHGTFSMRVRTDDEAAARAAATLVATVFHALLGWRARVAVRPVAPVEGTGVALDVDAGKDRPRAAHAPHVVRVLVLDNAAALLGPAGPPTPLRRLGDAAVLVVPSDQRSGDLLWAELPPYVKAVVYDRRARVLGWQGEREVAEGHDVTSRAWVRGAAFVGLALANANEGPSGEGRPRFDRARVHAEIEAAVLAALGSRATGATRHAAENVARRAADAGARAFDGPVEVPRAVVERDEDAVRLGRRDARSGPAPHVS
jgi:pyruvate-ferredoxin/flavodoxin oxidoreductase